VISLRSLCCCLLLASVSFAAVPSQAEERPPAWAEAHTRGPLSADETRDLMRRLLDFVVEHHLKRDPNSPQKGMVYEYCNMTRLGEHDQFVQGEALDTMHDGAWLAAALVNAVRATGDKAFRDLLVEYQLPFYCKMLNHSDTLFTNAYNHARPEAQKIWTSSKEWLLQDGEKGFVPYFWDDGGSISLERAITKNPLGAFPCYDQFVIDNEPNPQFRLKGYSLGSSNHLAQDLGVMVQQAWLLLRDSDHENERQLAREIADAARHLHECRLRHFGYIPMCVAPTAMIDGNAELMKRVPDPAAKALWNPANHYTKALYDFNPDQRHSAAGFADDQQYRYYTGIARAGGEVPRPLAFKTIYDACTEPLLYRYYSDDAPVPAGIGRFDLHPFQFVNGKSADYRSDRKGPFNGPRPIGSRVGPQNMICCGWSLQLLDAYPGIWEARYEEEFRDDLRVRIVDPVAQTVDASTLKKQAAALKLADVSLELVSTRHAIHISGNTEAEMATITVYSRPDKGGTHAVINLKADGTAQAVNQAGDALQLSANVSRGEPGFRFELTLPYTVSKEQGLWANGIEHGRYSIAVGETSRNLYLASDEAQVRAWLAHELGAGLRTWDAMFRELGYIPTGLKAGGQWQNFSDNGAYAHLISAGAQWLFVLEGKRDWEQHHVPATPRAP